MRRGPKQRGQTYITESEAEVEFRRCPGATNLSFAQRTASPSERLQIGDRQSRALEAVVGRDIERSGIEASISEPHLMGLESPPSGNLPLAVNALTLEAQVPILQTRKME